MLPLCRKRREWIRFFAFFLIPILMLAAANLLLLQSDMNLYSSVWEATHSERIDLALVGSSNVYADFNPQLISEKTGLETYSLSIGRMSLPGALAITRLLFEERQPAYTALVLEPDNFSETVENIQTQMRLSPLLRGHPGIALRYYLDLCSQDQRFIDRLLLFKSSMVQSPEDIQRNITLLLSPEKVLPISDSGNGLFQYQGRGFSRYMKDGHGYDALRFTPLKHDVIDTSPELHDYSKQKLLEYKALCEANGSQLLVIVAPNCSAQALGREGFLDKNAALAEFCRSRGIPFFDLSMARQSFIPLLDSYYYDQFHLDGTGADICSEKFAELLNLYLAGEPTDSLFYDSVDEYLDTLNFITNTWIEQRSEGGQDLFTADCLHGRTIQPEYAFYLVETDASLTLLRDYSPESTYRCEAGALSGKKLRVYARPVGSQEALPGIFNNLDIP